MSERVSEAARERGRMEGILRSHAMTHAHVFAEKISFPRLAQVPKPCWFSGGEREGGTKVDQVDHGDGSAGAGVGGGGGGGGGKEQKLEDRDQDFSRKQRV